MSELNFSSLVETMAQGVVYQDRAGKIVYANPAAEQILGLSQEEILGRTSHDERWQAIHDDGSPFNGDEHPSMEALRSAKPVSAVIMGVFNPQDQAYRWLQVDATPEFMPGQQEPYRVYSTFSDITALRASQKALERSATEWTEAMDSVEDVMYLLDNNRHLVRANKVFYMMMRTSAEEAVGKHIVDIVHPEGEEVPCPVCQAQEAKQDALITMEQDHPDNPSGRPIEVHVNVLRDHLAQPSGILMMIRDLTRIRQTDEQLRLAGTVFDNTSEGILITNGDKQILAVNRAACRITGFTREELEGSTPQLLKSGHHEENFYQEMWAQIGQNSSWSGEILDRRKDGEVIPLWLSISAVRDNHGVDTHYVSVFSDISALKASEQKLTYLAHHDPLTGLANRRLFRDRLEHAIKQAQRNGSILAIFFIDLDRFKNVNDSLGHTAGDQLLQQVAERFRAITRDGDTVARQGGDEFLMLVEGLKSHNDATPIAGKILDGLTQPFSLHNHEVYLSASIGICLSPDDGIEVDSLIKGADAAMYQAKEQGRNNYQFYSAELTEMAFERLMLESELRTALDEGHFTLLYQPRVDLTSHQVIGAEALIRWQHPKLGTVSPVKFINVAEESGLILPIGEWVLRSACAQAKAWLDQGLSMKSVAVNVSARQFEDPDFPLLMTQVLDETGLPAESLVVEITESIIMRDAENAAGILQELHALGIQIAIDDFGTGYSSLSYLKQFPIDILKIDRSFVRDLPDDKDDAAIARSIIALGQSMEMNIVAEGVEKEEQAVFLQRLACPEGQGYLWSQPLAVEAFEAYCQKSELTDPSS